MSKINFKSITSSITSTLTKGVDKYTSATNSAEKWIMTKCKSNRMMDDAIDSGIDTSITKTNVLVDRVKPVVVEKATAIKNKTVHLVKSIPMVSLPAIRREAKKDIWGELAQDAELAAALSYVHKMNHCIEVVSVEYDVPVVAPVVIVPAPVVEPSIPMVAPIASNAAPITGIYSEPGLTPATVTPLAKIIGTVRNAVVSVPMVTCK
jgi:hypothetical protein